MRCSEALLCFPFVGHVVWRVRRLFDSGTEVSRACALLPLDNAFLLSRTRVSRVVARASPLGCVAPNSACQSRIGNQILCARIPMPYLNGTRRFLRHALFYQAIQCTRLLSLRIPDVHTRRPCSVSVPFPITWCRSRVVSRLPRGYPFASSSASALTSRDSLSLGFGFRCQSSFAD